MCTSHTSPKVILEGAAPSINLIAQAILHHRSEWTGNGKTRTAGTDSLLTALKAQKADRHLQLCFVIACPFVPAYGATALFSIYCGLQ